MEREVRLQSGLYTLKFNSKQSTDSDTPRLLGHLQLTITNRDWCFCCAACHVNENVKAAGGRRTKEDKRKTKLRHLGVKWEDDWWWWQARLFQYSSPLTPRRHTSPRTLLTHSLLTSATFSTCTVLPFSLNGITGKESLDVTVAEQATKKKKSHLWQYLFCM